MTESEAIETEAIDPSMNRAGDDSEAPKKRVRTRRGDRSARRAHQSHYEDMLN